MPGLGPVNLRRWVEQAGSLDAALALARRRFGRVETIIKERDASFLETLMLPGAWALSWEGINYPVGWREMKRCPSGGVWQGCTFFKKGKKVHWDCWDPKLFLAGGGISL